MHGAFYHSWGLLFVFLVFIFSVFLVFSVFLIVLSLLFDTEPSVREGSGPFLLSHGTIIITGTQHWCPTTSCPYCLLQGSADCSKAGRLVGQNSRDPRWNLWKKILSRDLLSILNLNMKKEKNYKVWTSFFCDWYFSKHISKILE